MTNNDQPVGQDLAIKGFNFSGWPPRPVFSFYGPDGRLLHRSRSAKFDLTDSLGSYTGNVEGFIVFGISSQSTVTRTWTHEELSRQEENIRYDLSFDALGADINRVKGLGLRCSEEALWELHVAMVL